MWLGSSVVRVLARSARGPGFEFRSGHVLFPPPRHLEEHIAEREKEYDQPEIISYTGRDNAYERQRQEQLEEKFGEVERQRSLEDELKRRETLVKQEMEEERRRKLEAEEIVRRIDPQGSIITEEKLRHQELLSRHQQNEDNMRQRRTQLRYTVRKKSYVNKSIFAERGWQNLETEKLH